MTSKEEKNPEELEPFVTRMIYGTWVFGYFREGAIKPKSDEDDRDPWGLEKGRPPDWIGVPNITPETSSEDSRRLFWRAVRRSARLSFTEEDVLRKMKLWNSASNPQISEKRLEEKVRWAVTTKRWYPWIRKPK